MEYILTLIQLFISGIVNGAIYALMALGFALILECTGLFNFAHGAFYIIGGYVTYYFTEVFGINPLISMIIAVFFVAAIGFIIEKSVILQIRLRGGREWILAGLIALLSLSVSTENLCLILFGPEYRGLLPIFKGHIKLLSILLDLQKLINAMIALSTVLILYFFLNNTKLGLSIKALAQNRELVELCGINTSKLFSLVFAIGTALAGLAGALLISIYYVSPTAGHFPGLMAFIVVVMAGLGSIVGVILTGFILGITDSVTSYFLSPEWGYLIAFTICMLTLVLKPAGLFGIRRE
ncbi:MAG: branched-chain amino acid ABC transporter permease [Ignisphaera sp.]